MDFSEIEVNRHTFIQQNVWNWEKQIVGKHCSPI